MDSVKCIKFISNGENYLIPAAQVVEIIPLEKTAIFLKQKGWLIGKQMYHSIIVPIINLNDTRRQLLTHASPDLIIIRIINDRDDTCDLLSVLLESEATYVDVKRDDIALIADNGYLTKVAYQADEIIIPNMRAILTIIQHII